MTSLVEYSVEEVRVWVGCGWIEQLLLGFLHGLRRVESIAELLRVSLLKREEQGAGNGLLWRGNVT